MKSTNEIIGIVLVVVFAALVVTPVAQSHMHFETANPPVSPRQLTGLLWGSMSYEGMNRTFCLYVPSLYNGSRKVPLVLALHPAGGNGYLFGLQSGWMSLAETNGFIVVFPDGGIWYSLGYRWNVYNWTDSPNDAGFLMELINELESNYQIDDSRIYMTGHSSGAGMTTTFAFTNASVLAAIAPVSGRWITSYGMNPYNMSQPNAHLPVYIWRGELEDEEYGSLQEKDYWIDWNKAGKNPTYENEGIYKTEIYTGGYAEVRFTEIFETVHTYTYDSQTASKIWYDFFMGFRRSASVEPVFWGYLVIPIVISATVGVAVVIVIVRRIRRRDKQDSASLSGAVKPS